MRRLSRLAVLGWIALIPLSVAAEPAPEIEIAPPAIQEPSAETSAASGDTAAGSVSTTGTATSSDAAPSVKSTSETEKTAVAAPPPPPPEPTLLININLTTQRMVVTESGKQKYTWAVSSGAYGYPTPTGTFKPSWMSKMWYSKQYDNAPMPHSIFFKGGAAIHATSSIHLLGTPGVAWLCAPVAVECRQALRDGFPPRQGSHANLCSRPSKVYRTADRTRAIWKRPAHALRL